MTQKILIILISISLTIQTLAQGQKYYSKDARVSFYSKAPLEDIEAHNFKGACIIEQATGKVNFSILMKGFEFEKGLMQDHFNENYVESHKFPKATFTGIIKDKLPLVMEDGKQIWKVEGSLLLHGITNPLIADVKVSINKGVVIVESAFKINITAFGIKIPSVVTDKINEWVEIKIAPTQLQKL